MRQLIHYPLSKLFIVLKYISIEAIRSNTFVEVAHVHCLFNVGCAKVCALTVVKSVLTDDHSVNPFFGCFVDGFEVLLDVSVDIIDDFIIDSGDLHDNGTRGLHSQYSLGCLVELLHVTTAKHLRKVVDVGCLPEFVDEFLLLRFMHRLSP